MSRRFEFSLQKVLDIRRKLEDQLAAELQRVIARRREEEERLASLQREKTGLLNGPGDAGRTIGLNDIRVRGDYLSQLDDRMDRQRAVIQRWTKSEAAARQKLLQASHDKRMVEKLRERSLADHRRKQLAAETLQESEVALRITLNRKHEDSRE